MHWQLGGNLLPVQMICEVDWRACPSAIVNYVWSEIVTDVVDCLTNEWTIWRMIAMLFVCSLLVHAIFSRTRLVNDTQLNRKNLGVVGCKVQDLELKVNILTYKMQYGTWPLPREIQAAGSEKGLKNVRLTLTDSRYRNTWLKHMLLSPTEKSSFVPYAKIGPRSIRCLTKLINLETKYVSSRFSHEGSADSNGTKITYSSSEKSLKSCTSQRYIEFEMARKFPGSENLASRREEASEKREKKAGNTKSDSRVVKYRGEIESMKNLSREMRRENWTSRKLEKYAGGPVERVNATNETLLQVREKLENLHSVLRIYGEEASRQEATGGETKKKELAETILRDLKNLGEATTSDERTGENSDSRAEEKSEEKNATTSDDSATYRKIHTELRANQEKASKIVAKKSEKNFQISDSEAGKRSEKLPENSDELRENSPVSSLTEISKDSEDEKTNVALLCEAVKIKNALITRFEQENSGKIGENRSDESESEENNNWPKVKPQFQPKLLDIISEEQSASSSNEKNPKNIQIPEKKPENRRSTIEHEIDGKNGENFLNKNFEVTSGSSEYFSAGNVDETSVDRENSENSEKCIKPWEIDSDQRKSIKIPKNSTKNVPNVAIHDEEQESKKKLIANKFSDDQTAEENSKNYQPLETSRKAQCDEIFQENMHELVGQSAQNIREYIEIFSRLQSDAIAEAKKAMISQRAENDTSIIDENRFSNWTEEKKEMEKTGEISSKSSLDSLTRFVIAINRTESEELPRKLSEPAIIRLVDLEAENSGLDSWENSEVNFELKRRPGAISLAENSFSEFPEDQDPNFESANSVSSEQSCKELLLEYSASSGTNCIDEKIAQNLMFFEEEKLQNFEEKMRFVDSPLTGRTVIQATGSSSSGLVSLMEVNDFADSPNDFKDDFEVDGQELDNVEEFIDIDEMKAISEIEIDPESSSMYFTDRASFPEISEPVFGPENDCNGGENDKLEMQNTCNSKDSDSENLEKIDEKNARKPEVVDEVCVSKWGVSNCEMGKNRMKPEVSLGEANSPRKPEGSWISSEKPEVESNFRENTPENPKKTPRNRDLPKTHESIEKPEMPEYFEGKPEVTVQTHDYRSREPEVEKKIVENQVSNDAIENPRTIDEITINRTISGRTIVLNSPRPESAATRRSNSIIVSKDPSDLYMDANSRDFLDFSAQISKIEANERSFWKNTSNKSARGSSSSPLRQHVPWSSAPRRGSSLNNATPEKLRKSEKTSEKPPLKSAKAKFNLSKDTKKMSNFAPSRTKIGLSGSKDLESSNITFGRRSQVDSSVELRDKRSRSYATPRRSDTSPRNFESSSGQKIVVSKKNSDKRSNSGKNVDNSESLESEAIGRSRKDRDPGKKERKTEKFAKPMNPCDPEESIDFPDILLSNKNSTDPEENSLDVQKSDKSCPSKNSSKSCIPILRSRLCAVRQTSNERRTKSPARCPLTLSTSSWNVENRLIGQPENVRAEGFSECEKSLFRGFEDDEPRESVRETSLEDKKSDEKMEKLPTESRTVIYVNIVTDREQKSTTRFVDPKKFLEYLKDRDLKVRSVQDAEIGAEKSSKVLTIVSSAVDDRDSKSLPGDEKSRASWSLRVERREIQVSAKPSVIDTSTSISDFPESTGDEKFQIFQVPKELTKDEYILLLEALNQDPNLHQLREMHKLCNKLGLGFHE